jgi:hypothetical protein
LRTAAAEIEQASASLPEVITGSPLALESRRHPA